MTRAEVVEVPGEFSVRGGILDVFPTDASDPVRIEFFGDEVESIRPFDAESQRSLDRWNSVSLTAALGLDEIDPARFGHPADFFPEGTWVLLLEPNDLREEGRHYLGRVPDASGLFAVEESFERLIRYPDDRGLDAGRRLAGDDLPPADRERRAVLGRPGQGQGRAGRRLGRRPRPDRLPQRRRGRAAGRGLLRHRAGPIRPADPDRRPGPVGLPPDRRPDAGHRRPRAVRPRRGPPPGHPPALREPGHRQLPRPERGRPGRPRQPRDRPLSRPAARRASRTSTPRRRCSSSSPRGPSCTSRSPRSTWCRSTSAAARPSRRSRRSARRPGRSGRSGSPRPSSTSPRS